MAALVVDLHKLSKAVNLALFGFMVLSFLSGLFVSFYFHFLTVSFLFLNVVNFFYIFVQRKHGLLRNFGILAQGRYILESLGPELRQYLFLNDTEERPFNREERGEVYRKAKGIDSASSFGSLGQFDAHEIKIRHSLFPVPLDKLEPFQVTFGDSRELENAYTISHPLIIGAMSYGALGERAVRALSRGARLANIPMNTGEGGFPKYHLQEGGDLIFQIGTAKFGVRNDDGSLNDEQLVELAALPQIKMIEIKFSQGAKPGKGGLLPKEKISREISELRGVPMGQDVISPPGHIECKDIVSTVRFIKRVQEVSQLPTGIKLCLGRLEEFEALVEEMMKQDIFPDWIAVDGAEGGTGAAPKSFMDKVGVPILPALHLMDRALSEREVRDKTKIIAAGKLINAGRMLAALAIGADACYSARGFMLALGCIQALHCGDNSCPVGITTHDPSLQRGLDVAKKAERVVNYVERVKYDFKQMLAATGYSSEKGLSIKDLYIPSGSDLYPYIEGISRRRIS